MREFRIETVRGLYDFKAPHEKAVSGMPSVSLSVSPALER
jgi:hypothetical protein